MYVSYCKEQDTKKQMNKPNFSVREVHTVM